MPGNERWAAGSKGRERRCSNAEDVARRVFSKQTLLAAGAAEVSESRTAG